MWFSGQCRAKSTMTSSCSRFWTVRTQVVSTSLSELSFRPCRCGTAHGVLPFTKLSECSLVPGIAVLAEGRTKSTAKSWRADPQPPLLCWHCLQVGIPVGLDFGYCQADDVSERVFFIQNTGEVKSDPSFDFDLTLATRPQNCETKTLRITKQQMS